MIMKPCFIIYEKSLYEHYICNLLANILPFRIDIEFVLRLSQKCGIVFTWALVSCSFPHGSEQQRNGSKHISSTSVNFSGWILCCQMTAYCEDANAN